MDNFDIRHVALANSTNDLVRTFQSKSEFVVASTDYQTAGRGQRGNTWESADGKNLLFSILLRPTFLAPRHQFLLSQSFSLAICSVLKSKVEGVSVKWPNDIYIGNKKVAGILIEQTLRGSEIETCCIGVGLNVNQATFVSDAPNPCSLLTETGQEYDRENLLDEILISFEKEYRLLQKGIEPRERYMSKLYRRNGFFTYKDSKGLFEAKIIGVEPEGNLIMKDKEGTTRSYAFKEVSFVI